MSGKKTVTLVSASPKLGEPSASDWLSERLCAILEDSDTALHRLNVRQSMLKPDMSSDYETMLSSDVLVFIFPLYFFCLPGVLIRYLQDYYSYYIPNKASSKTVKVFCVVNSGFPEADINLEAVRVIRSFSGKIGADFRLGLMIGCGGMLASSHDARFMRKMLADVDGAFRRMKSDIQSGDAAQQMTMTASPRGSRRLFYFIGNQMWVSMAKKNKVSRKMIYTRPYV